MQQNILQTLGGWVESLTVELLFIGIVIGVTLDYYTNIAGIVVTLYRTIRGI